MFRLGKEKSRRHGSDRQAEWAGQKAGAAVGRGVDTLSPKVADGWHVAVVKTGAAGAEAKLRGKAIYHALKGDLRMPEPVNYRKRNIALAVGTVGAAAGAAYLAARRRRQPEWLTTDITPESELQSGMPTPTAPGQSSRMGDRAAASVDEMISDAAETASSAATKARPR